MDINLIAILAIASYLGAGVMLTLRLLQGENGNRNCRRIGLLLATFAALLQGWGLFQELVTPVGLNLSFFNMLSLAAWTIVLLLLFSAVTKPVENLGIVLLPSAGVSMILALRFPEVHLLGQSNSAGLNIHILLSLLAYSLLTLAVVQALLLAVQDQHLHSRHPGGFIRALPPLQTMETLLFEMIATGFFLLSLALLSGLIFLENMFAQHIAHKTILSICSWLVFGGLLWGRFRFGWRGKIAIKGTLAGFILLMLAYFGSKAVLELVLR